MINKQRCTPNPSRSPKVSQPNTSKEYGDMRKGDGVEPMEFRPVDRKPYWEGPGGKVSWGDE